jgi:hypothetical protein
MSKLTNREKLILSVLTNKPKEDNTIYEELRCKGLATRVIELNQILYSLKGRGYVDGEEGGEGWVLVGCTKKPSKIKTIIASVLLFYFAIFLLSGSVAVVIWIWTGSAVAAKYAASYGVFMLTVVWFGFLFKWSEMMQNRYND